MRNGEASKREDVSLHPHDNISGIINATNLSFDTKCLRLVRHAFSISNNFFSKRDNCYDDPN
ncbi:hypothetical protein N9Y42_05920, partial [Mariniblastus sp.]|nr:hypothetical protein [Mariniblastus sp.]